MPGFKMDDYVPVNERIEQFYTSYPEGSLQSELVELTGTRVTVKAYAYRKPDDPHPGVGHSSCDIPGSTPYTKGSEVENAETSAWGRAIAALGFEVKRGIASREEVRNKQQEPGEQGREASRNAGATTQAPAQYRRGELAELLAELHLGDDVAKHYATLYGVRAGERASDEQMDQIIDAVRGHVSGADLTLPLDSGDPNSSDEPEAVPSSPAIPPKPGTDEYKALDARDKAAARAHWAKEEVTA